MPSSFSSTGDILQLITVTDRPRSNNSKKFAGCYPGRAAKHEPSRECKTKEFNSHPVKSPEFQCKSLLETALFQWLYNSGVLSAGLALRQKRDHIGGFKQPVGAHSHWHTDISYVKIREVMTGNSISR